MTMPILPDWQQGMYLIGQDPDGDPILVQTDESGNIVAVFKGMGPTGLDTIALDGAGRIIAVIRDPTSDNYIAIDGSGQIVAVFKGMGPEGLITLKADKEGRMIAILTDPEDTWGTIRQMGMTELSARQHMAYAYDRRGDVIFMDDFSHGLRSWLFSHSGGTETHNISTVTAYSGSYSLMLDAGILANQYKRATYYGRRVKTTRMGAKVAFVLGASSEPVGIWFRYYNGTHFYDARLYYYKTEKKLKYRNSGGGYTDLVTDLDLAVGWYTFNHLKLVINTETHEYVRAMINEHEVTMDGIAIEEDTNTTSPRWELMLHNARLGGVNSMCYFDDIVITVNEPANPEE